MAAGDEPQSPERRLVETSELARMQRVAARAQEIERLQADLQMLGDGALVKGIGGAGQLDLAVERLVRYAQQRAVGYAQAEALGGDGAAFHIDGDGAREVDASALLREAQFPVAVVVGDDSAGAKD